MTTIPANLPHRYADYETGHILYVDPITGEIISRKEMNRPKHLEAQFQAWAAERRADPFLPKDALKVSRTLASRTPEDAPSDGPGDAPERGRGRPKTAFANPVAAYIHMLVVPELLPWLDDLIHGAIITSAGITNGKVNAKARAVIGALFLSEIKAGFCQTHEISLRTAQRIAKAARHVAHGIASYVERHPEIKARLDAETKAESGASALNQGWPI